MHAWADPEGGDIDPDPPKNHKATKPAFNGGPLAFNQNAISKAFADGLMVVHF